MKIEEGPTVLPHLPQHSLDPYHLMQLRRRLLQLTWPQHRTAHAGLDIPFGLHVGSGTDGTLGVCSGVFPAFEDVEDVSPFEDLLADAIEDP